MPIVKRFKNCVVRINARDHNPPHVHIVMSDGREALVDLNSMDVMGSINRREISETLAWITDNTAELRRLFEELTK
ncbi:MAG: DUF4160 domain-containing protein [Candidatus Ozemobacteraceae bacterium]